MEEEGGVAKVGFGKGMGGREWRGFGATGRRHCVVGIAWASLGPSTRVCVERIVGVVVQVNVHSRRIRTIADYGV